MNTSTYHHIQVDLEAFFSVSSICFFSIKHINIHYLEQTFYATPLCYDYNPPLFCHPHSLHNLLRMFWTLTFPTFPHDQGNSHSATRCEQSNQNVLLTSQGWCIFDWLPNFHVECFMHLCKLSSSIHLFVVHFVTCHHLLTSQRFCSHKLFLLGSFFSCF